MGTGGSGDETRSGDDQGQKLVDPARLIGTGGESGVRAGVRSGVACTDSVERSEDWRLTEDESVVERDEGVRCTGDDVVDETSSTLTGGECGGSWIDSGPAWRRLVDRPSPFVDVASAGMSLARRSSRAMQCPSSDAPDASTFGSAAAPGDTNASGVAWPAPSTPDDSMRGRLGRELVVWPPRACVGGRPGRRLALAITRPAFFSAALVCETRERASTSRDSRLSRLELGWRQL